MGNASAVTRFGVAIIPSPPGASSLSKRLATKGIPELATCSITELGFVRVLAQAPQYGFTVGQACDLLQRLKAAGRVNFTLIPDAQDISHLPPWVKTAKQTTDGHLAQLAGANRAVLATLDRGIPQALLIPVRES